MSKKNLNDKSFMKLRDEKVSKTLFKYALYEYLSPKRILFEYKLSKHAFDVVIKNIINGFKNALVESGEMVGCVAANHIGEVIHK